MAYKWREFIKHLPKQRQEEYCSLVDWEHFEEYLPLFKLTKKTDKKGESILVLIYYDGKLGSFDPCTGKRIRPERKVFTYQSADPEYREYKARKQILDLILVKYNKRFKYNKPLKQEDLPI